MRPCLVCGLFAALVAGGNEGEDGVLHGRCSVYVGRSIASRFWKTGRASGQRLGTVNGTRHFGRQRHPTTNVARMRARWTNLPPGARPSILIAVAILVVAAIAGGSNDNGDKSPTRKAPAQSAPAATEAAKPAPRSNDTGRMSTSEWEGASDTIDQVNGEIRDYREAVAGRCSTIMSAGEVSDSLKCVDDAFDGVEDQAGLTTQTLSDVLDDTAKNCRKQLRRARDRLNRPLFQALRVSQKSIESGNSVVIELAAKSLLSQLRLWGDATGDMLEACSPA